MLGDAHYSGRVMEVPSLKYKVCIFELVYQELQGYNYFFPDDFFSVLLRWFVSASTSLSHSLSQGKTGKCFTYIST